MMRGRIVQAMIAGAVILPGALWTAAQEPAAAGRLWQETYDYTLEIDNAASGTARLYLARGRAAMLIVASELTSPLVLDMQARQVKGAPGAEPRDVPEEQAVELADEAASTPPAPYATEGESVIFYWDQHRLKIVRRSPLVGEVDLEALLSRLPIYRKGIESYEPAASDVEYLRSYAHPVTVRVFFGSWCPHCRQVVPRFIKSVQAAGSEKIQIAFTGVPTPFSNYAPAKESQVKGVPTFIVLAGGKEIGRFSAVPSDSSVEHELVKILTAHAQERG